MTLPVHELTSRNLAKLEQDVGVHFASWLGAQSNDASGYHQHSSMLSFMENKHTIILQALTVTQTALVALQNTTDPKTTHAHVQTTRLQYTCTA